MTDTTYNGWVNRETWNANLRLTNEEGLFRAALRLVTGVTLWSGARALSEFARETWPEGVTPDGDSLDRVNWCDIAKGLRD